MNQERRARLDGVREALRVSMTAWATLEVRGDQARVVPAPQLEVLVGQLDRAEGGEWTLHWACDGMQPPVVRARLGAAGLEREGLATGLTLEDARLAALADVARLYGISVPGEGHWVDYDPEEGADTTLLEAETEAAPPAPRPSLPPEPPRDPQMEKARGHIDDLIAQLRAAGHGKDIAPILMRGYGSTLEESRQIYKELQAVLREA
ncbi:single-stranded DNA-binding protein [Deinococcus sp. Marseille-Q6407]|uniref:single-stranded DNA-binding protein n=1 Tax=Deinococcus sp. Marseille-Q6407 TaxID=2969223 RepID=UPI0021BE1EE0|nr:single-stranded DNA-binding protein [Deinococcus sp. Marseille-Q6407]